MSPGVPSLADPIHRHLSFSWCRLSGALSCTSFLRIWHPSVTASRSGDRVNLVVINVRHPSRSLRLKLGLLLGVIAALAVLLPTGIQVYREYHRRRDLLGSDPNS